MHETFNPDDLDRQLAARGKRTSKLSDLIPRTAVAFADKYLPFEQSPAWRAVRAATHGDPYDADVLETVIGYREAQPGGYRLTVVVAGRRSGKTANQACDAVFEAVVHGAEHMKFLAPGQRGYIVVVCRTVRQGSELFRYARGIVERNPELANLVDGDIQESQTGGEIRFLSGVVVTVLPASKGAVRGYTILGATLDEWAWVATDEDSANQDKEILAAIAYGSLTPTGAPARRISIISSPAAKSGTVYDNYVAHHGKPGAPTLVAHGPTWMWNPSIDLAVLEEERMRDPKTFSREVLGEFHDAISAWCEASVIDRAAVGRTAVPLERDIKIDYLAGVDFGLKRDSTVLCIGHLEEVPNALPRFVCDGVWAWKPTPEKPLDSQVVVEAMVKILDRYRIRFLVGDQFSAIALRAEFRRWEVDYRELIATSQSKIEFFGKLREALHSNRVSLPADPTLLLELRELQERLSPSGNVQISAPQRATAHDDHACAVAWLFACTQKYKVTHCTATYSDPLAAEYSDGSEERLAAFVAERMQFHSFGR